MRKFLLVAAASILIPLGGVQASVSGDLAKGVSLDQLVVNASRDNLSIEELIEQVAAVDQGLVASIVAKAIESGLDASTVLAAAFKAAPTQAKVISEAVIKQVAAIDQKLVAGIVAKAIESGVDAESVVAVAFKAAPAQAKSISEAAQAKSVDFTVVAAASLGIPGIDPTQVTPASAAGGTTPAAGGTTPAAGGTTATQTITAPTFSSGGGSGGGGTGSPSA